MLSLVKPLEILYDDGHYVAIDKPAGMKVHRGEGTSPLEMVALQTLRDQIGCRIFPVHRLDQPTSGVLVFGRTVKAAAKLVELFTHRRVTKHYQALVVGWSLPEGTIRLPLETNAKGSLQPACTDFATIRRYQIHPEYEDQKEPRTYRFSWLELTPHTGRWHQLRRHLAMVERPILGDYRHGQANYNDWLQRRIGSDRMMLASVYLGFQHPFSEKFVEIRARRSKDFNSALELLEPHACTMSYDSFVL